MTCVERFNLINMLGRGAGWYASGDGLPWIWPLISPAETIGMCGRPSWRPSATWRVSSTRFAAAPGAIGA